MASKDQKKPQARTFEQRQKQFQRIVFIALSVIIILAMVATIVSAL
jgi:hypothetical protein